MKLVYLLISGVLAFALLGGCGSGGDETTAERDPLTKAEFRKQANAICAAAERRRDAAVGAMTGGEELDLNDRAAVANLILAAILPAVREMTQELSELGAPDARAAAVVAAYEASIEGTGAHPRRFLRGESERLAKSRDLALAYGLEACGRI